MPLSRIPRRKHTLVYKRLWRLRGANRSSNEDTQVDQCSSSHFPSFCTSASLLFSINPSCTHMKKERVEVLNNSSASDLECYVRSHQLYKSCSCSLHAAKNHTSFERGMQKASNAIFHSGPGGVSCISLKVNPSISRSYWTCSFKYVTRYAAYPLASGTYYILFLLFTLLGTWHGGRKSRRQLGARFFWRR